MAEVALGDRDAEPELLGGVRPDRDARHQLDAAGDGDLDGAGGHEAGGKVGGLLRGAALRVDGGDGGGEGPALSQAVRPTLNDCSPTWLTQPVTTCSTSAGSMPERPTTSLSATPSRSTGWTVDSSPFRRPTGVRTASTITTSAITGGYARPGCIGEWRSKSLWPGWRPHPEGAISSDASGARGPRTSSSRAAPTKATAIDPRSTSSKVDTSSPVASRNSAPPAGHRGCRSRSCPGTHASRRRSPPGQPTSDETDEQPPEDPHVTDASPRCGLTGPVTGEPEPVRPPTGCPWGAGCAPGGGPAQGRPGGRHRPRHPRVAATGRVPGSQCGPGLGDASAADLAGLLVEPPIGLGVDEGELLGHGLSIGRGVTNKAGIGTSPVRFPDHLFATRIASAQSGVWRARTVVAHGRP